MPWPQTPWLPGRSPGAGPGARSPAGCGTGRNGGWPWTCSMRSPGRRRRAAGGCRPGPWSPTPDTGRSPPSGSPCKPTACRMLPRSKAPPAPARPEPTDYWLSDLPVGTSLRDLVRLAKIRWRVEHDYRELKDGLGLDHFEGRSYTGWHRHVTLTALAQAFCTQLRYDPKAPAP